VPRVVTLVDHDPAWPALFSAEARRIRQALGERALLVEHVGSTSVSRSRSGEARRHRHGLLPR
jgi:GrpB-like predicted nucleotidyltransferase (UPF0157 family)